MHVTGQHQHACCIRQVVHLKGVVLYEVGAACVYYRLVSSLDRGKEVRRDVFFCLLSSQNNKRQSNYCNYSVYSDDSDVSL